jgi:hypothetical protein
MRNRIQSPIYSVKPSGLIIKRCNKLSAHARRIEVLKELGLDVKEYAKECRLRSLFRMQAAGLLA